MATITDSIMDTLMSASKNRTIHGAIDGELAIAAGWDQWSPS